MITYKFHIKPSSEQCKLLWKHSCMLNTLYNYFIEFQRNLNKNNASYFGFYALIGLIPQYKDDNPEYKEVFSQSLQRVAYRVHCAYTLFFRGIRSKNKVSPPSFRSCNNFFNIDFPQINVGYKEYLSKGIISFSKYGNIPVNVHREIKGDIKTVTIHYDGRHWYVLITTTGDYEKVKSKHTDPFWIGIDLGTTDLVTTSEGEKIKGPRHFTYFDPIVDQLKSKRDAYKKGSRNHKHYSNVIRKLCRIRSNKMRNDLHHISKDLSSTCDIICVEDLSAKKMSETKATGRNKNIRNVYWGLFVNMLEYKTNRLVKVNPVNTSKTCCRCGHLQSMPTSQRTYTCPNCGLQLDRDHNAAINILNLGRAKVDGHCVVNATIQDVQSYVYTNKNILYCLGTGLWAIQRSR